MDYIQFYAQQLHQAKYGDDQKISFVEQAKRFFMPKNEVGEDKTKPKNYAMLGVGALAIGGVGLFIYQKRKSGAGKNPDRVESFSEVMDIIQVADKQEEERENRKLRSLASEAPPRQALVGENPGLDDLLSQLTHAEMDALATQELGPVQGRGSENIEFQDMSQGKGFHLGDLGMTAISIQE